MAKEDPECQHMKEIQLIKSTQAVHILSFCKVNVNGWCCKTNGAVQYIDSKSPFVVRCCLYRLEMLIFEFSHMEKNVSTHACN